MRQEICATCEGPCTRACPESILLRHPADHACAGLPYLSFQEAGCTFCGACAEACPANVPPSHARPVLGRADIDPTRCLAWKQVVCMACQDPCPERAIERSPRGRPRISSQACSGCGCCVSVCPVQAITVRTV